METFPKTNSLESGRIWFDPTTNTLGFGITYGEHSFNGKPIEAIVDQDALKAFRRSSSNTQANSPSP